MLVYAVTSETFGILVKGAGLLLMSDASASESQHLAAICATLAMASSLAFNALFGLPPAVR